MATNPENPMIETDRLLCERLSPAHAAEVWQYLSANRQHLAPWEPLRAADDTSPAACHARIGPQLDEVARGSAERYVVRLRSSSEVIGAINYTNICPAPFLACHLGYSLAASAQGQGLMGEALAATLGFIFSERKLHRVMANYMPCNQRSAAVLRRLGFAVEGFARAYLQIAGQWEDHVLTSLLAEDQPSRRLQGL